MLGCALEIKDFTESSVS